jgi:c-di-AMP phosphodiesterase-like protein
MPNGTGKGSENWISKTKIYIVIIAILLVIISVLNYKLIIPSIVVFILVLVYALWTNKKRKAELSEQLKDLTLDVSKTAKTTLINSPFPLVIAEMNGNIIWKSGRFDSLFADIDINNYIEEILRETKLNIENGTSKKEKGEINTEIFIENVPYRVVGSYVRSHKKDENKETNYTTILYFIDEAENKKLEQIAKDTDLCVGIIMIDNYEEILQRVSTEAKAQFTAAIEKTIYDWAQKFNGLTVKTDRDTFYLFINRKDLKEASNEKLTVLDDVKKIDINIVDGIQATLSIAISNDGNNNIEKATSAKAVIDIALGRGGDQGIIKVDGKYEFFGGRTQEVEKRTKVKARMISHALTELIKESDNVLIMGHANSDMDAIGSAMGIYRLATTIGKEAKIVNENIGIGIDRFIEAVKKEDEYETIFVANSEAEELVTPNTLLVVVDTNKKTFVDSPTLLDKVSRVVVIDHHRRSTDYIENTILTFHEVYASSASELVTEILEYAQVPLKLTNLEIEALYAGIMLDTKNFTFKTGVRTFEAAAFLRRCGVDIIRVKKWFQNDLETYQAISEIVSRAEVVNDSIAISIYDNDNDKNANILIAKAADELLSISGITASFVLGEMDKKVYISGRSIGDINVQLILEKLGGGGHITLAGAQMTDVTIEEAKQELINRINEYMFEVEN